MTRKTDWDAFNCCRTIATAEALRRHLEPVAQGPCDTMRVLTPIFFLYASRPATTRGAPLTNEHESCAAWAAAGECARNPDYMLESCRVRVRACVALIGARTRRERIHRRARALRRRRARAPAYRTTHHRRARRRVFPPPPRGPSVARPAALLQVGRVLFYRRLPSGWRRGSSGQPV